VSQSGWEVAPDVAKFVEAIKWFFARVPIAAELWQEFTQTERRKAFTVAGVARADVLNDVFKAMGSAIENGTPLGDFKKSIGQKLRDEWQGSVKNPAWRLEVIYRNNCGLAHSAGRWAQMNDPAILPIRPFGMYDSIMDLRTTERCETLDGVVLPMEEFAKRGWIPPLHHACRGGIRSLRRKQAERQEKFGKPPPKVQAQDGWGAPPDKAEWKPDLTKYPPELSKQVKQHLAKANSVGPMPAPKGTKFVEPVKPSVQHPKPSDSIEWDSIGAADRKRIEAAMKAADESHAGKPANVRVAVGDPEKFGGPAKANGIHAPLADGDGWGIVINPKSDSKELDFLHEYGHQVDRAGLKLTTKSGAIASEARKLPEVKALIAAIDKSAASKRIAEVYAKVAGKSAEAASHLEYMARRSEQFARAYAQFVAKRSGNKTLLKQLEDMRKGRDDRGYLPMQWEDDDFGPIEKALEALLGKLGNEP